MKKPVTASLPLMRTAGPGELMDCTAYPAAEATGTAAKIMAMAMLAIRTILIGRRADMDFAVICVPFNKVLWAPVGRHVHRATLGLPQHPSLRAGRGGTAHDLGKAGDIAGLAQRVRCPPS